MTTTTEASEALDRLREVVKPGGTVSIVTRGYTRSGTRKVCLYTTAPLGSFINLTYLAKHALDTPFVRNTYCLGVHPGTTPDFLLDRLSVALFGEPGQIKGEYL